MKRNNINKWIDMLERSGNGFARMLFSFFDLHQYVELRCTTRILDKYVLYYIQNNPIFDPTTPVRDIKNFLRLFPHATAIALPWQHNIHMMLQPNIFVGSNIRYIDLHGVDFRYIPDFNPANFTNVETLYLHNCTIASEHFFTCMQNVRSLSLRDSRVRIDGIDCFSHLQSLEYLDISNANDGLITSDCLEYLDGISVFKATRCYDVTDDVIEVLTRSGCLQELNIMYCISPLLTRASIPLLKTVPVLNVGGTYISSETCDVCGRERDISNIMHHLTYECNMNCQLCNKSIEIYSEGYHLATECTQNHIECTDCHIMILRKNQRRHHSRCMNRTITCTHCNDTKPYYKKDFYFHLQNYEENYFEHFQSLKQKRALLILDLDNLQQEINDMIADAPATRFRLNEPRIPPKHTMFIQQMEQNITKHVNKPLKKLYIECNMRTQLLAMRQKHKIRVERIIEDMYDMQRREEEEYWIDDDIRERRRDRW
jgi:hypothetical protein